MNLPCQLQTTRSSYVVGVTVHWTLQTACSAHFSRCLFNSNSHHTTLYPTGSTARMCYLLAAFSSLAHYQSQLGHLAFMPGIVCNTEPHITAVADMSKQYKSLNPAMKGSAGQGSLSCAVLPCTECLRVFDAALANRCPCHEACHRSSLPKWQQRHGVQAMQKPCVPD